MYDDDKEKQTWNRKQGVMGHGIALSETKDRWTMATGGREMNLGGRKKKKGTKKPAC